MGRQMSQSQVALWQWPRSNTKVSTAARTEGGIERTVRAEAGTENAQVEEAEAKEDELEAGQLEEMNAAEDKAKIRAGATTVVEQNAADGAVVGAKTEEEVEAARAAAGVRRVV